MSGALTDPNDPASGFINPQAMGLLGMAGGLAQAAMPSRMPVPTGAALGMGAAGLMQGATQQRDLQKLDLANQGSAISNRMAMMRLPLFQAMINGQMGGGAGGMAPSGGAGGAVPGAITSPASMLSSAPTYAALGMDGLATQMVKGGLEMAGGTGYTPRADGSSTYTPGSGQDPNVVFRNKSAEGWGGLAADMAKNGMVYGPNGVSPMPGYQATASGNAAATAAGTEAGGAPYKAPVTYQATGPDGQVHDYTVPLTTYAAGAGSGNTPAQRMPGTEYAARVAHLESGAAPGAQNPNSTAGGPSQFTDPTWQAFMQAAHPEITDPQQIAAAKSNPALAQEGTLWLARQNATPLAQAGVPVNAATLGLAHHVGGQGAADLLRAPPNTPLAAIPSLHAAMGANPATGAPINPDLAGKTAGQVASTYMLRFGTLPVDLSGPSAPQQGPLGGVQGKPVLNPEQEAISKQYGEQAAAVVQAADKAPVGLQKLDVIQNATQAFQPSATGEARLAAWRNIAGALQTFGVTPPAWMANGAAGGETIGKEGVQLAADMTKSLGSREAASVLTRMISVMPNVSMSNGGFQAITAGLRQGLQRDQDIGAFQGTWLQSHSSTAGMHEAFDSQHPPEAYASRVVPFPPPKSASAAIPNVIYNTPRGPLLWTGGRFTSPVSQ